MSHLRSTAKPQFDRLHTGRILVHTECGQTIDSALVDNEIATCSACRSDTLPPSSPALLTPDGGAEGVEMVTRTIERDVVEWVCPESILNPDLSQAVA